MTGLDRDWRTARIRWYPRSGPRRPVRAMWATWCDDYLGWRCHIAGFGMQPALFLLARQSQALAVCRLLSWSNRYLCRPDAGLWDGRPDVALIREPVGSQLDLFGFGFGGGVVVSGGVGVWLSGEAAATPPTPPDSPKGSVTPLLSPFERKNDLLVTEL